MPNVFHTECMVISDQTSRRLARSSCRILTIHLAAHHGTWNSYIDFTSPSGDPSCRCIKPTSCMVLTMYLPVCQIFTNFTVTQHDVCIPYIPLHSMVLLINLGHTGVTYLVSDVLLMDTVARFPR